MNYNLRRGMNIDSNAAYNNTLDSNTISGNNQTGIYLGQSSYNIIKSNTISSNTDYGIYLYKFFTAASNNLIYNNNFTNNTVNAYDHSGNTNIWNTSKTAGPNILGGPYLAGNYWDDYTGTDTDWDLLGDTLTPYNSSENIGNQGDYAPLIATNLTTTLINPANNTTINTSIYTFNYWPTSANNISYCFFIVNNTMLQNDTTITTNSANYFHHSNLTNGSYNWQVNCTDINSNWNSSKLWLFNVSINSSNLDGDSLPDSADPLLGTNESVISTTINNPGIFINNSTDLSQNFTGTSELTFSNSAILAEFNWTFDITNPLNLFQITFETQADGATSGATLFSYNTTQANHLTGMVGTKTIYVENISGINRKHRHTLHQRLRWRLPRQ